MLMDADFSYSHYEQLEEIEDIVKSGADLTRQLLGFARKGKYEVKPVNLNLLIERNSQMFGRTKREIKIHTKYQKNPWTVDADAAQIEQVLLNLFVNAWQAMPGGGQLYLQTQNVNLNEAYVRAHDVDPGRYVRISIADTGTGMDRATQERIFDPFFTTKAMGRGTGLGLASAYGIIRNHGGIINLNSKLGEGTTFNIFLPASKKEIPEEKTITERFSMGTETILLVDDEDVVVDIGKKTLEKMGYNVLTARNGKEAIELYKHNQAEIDIVVLDMVMPEMGGGEVYDVLKEINPNAKVILSSGYSVEGEATEILERGCNGFVQKPFKPGVLTEKIREILRDN
jgi:CheY-like chemotaxis protein